MSAIEGDDEDSFGAKDEDWDIYQADVRSISFHHFYFLKVNL